jgi:cytochrome c-type biogenesis protein CcmH/NrfF
LTLLAHLGHYTWVLFIPPVLIVLGSIVHTTLQQRRQAREEDAEREGDGAEEPEEEG